MKQSKQIILFILGFAIILFNGCEHCPYYPTPPVYSFPFFLSDASNLYAVKVVYNGDDGDFTTDINVYKVGNSGINKIRHKTFKGSYKWGAGVDEFNYYKILPITFDKKRVILEDTKNGYVYLYDVINDSKERIGKLNSSRNKCSYDRYSLYSLNTVILNESKILEVFNLGFLAEKDRKNEEPCVEDYVTREEIPIDHPEGVKYYYLNYDEESGHFLYSFVKANEIVIDQLNFNESNDTFELGNYLGKITMETLGQPFKFITFAGDFLIAQKYSFCTTSCSHPNDKGVLYLYNYRENRLVKKITLDLDGMQVDDLSLMYARKVSDGIFVIFREVAGVHSIAFIPLAYIPEEIKLYPLHICRGESYWCWRFKKNIYNFGWIGNKIYFIGNVDLGLQKDKCNFKGIDTFSVYRIFYDSSSGEIEFKEVGNVE